MPGIHRRVDGGETVQLSATASKRLALNSFLVTSFVRDVAYNMALSQSFRAAFVTDLPRQVELLKSLRADVDPGLGTSQFETVMPFLGNITTDDLIRVRKREAESFVQYRAALVRAISEMRDRRAGFTKKDAENLYSDVVAPKLAKLDQAVATAKREAVNSAAPSVMLAAVVAAVSVGLYAGISLPDLLIAAKALGLGTFGAGISNAVAGAYKRRTAENVVRNEDFYFLWKVKNLST